jgi:sigma-70-like protein
MDNRAEEMRRMKSGGMSLQQIGDLYNISRERVRQIIGISDDEKKKVTARVKAQNAVRSGRISKRPCKVCGDENSEAHHEDYDKPLEVVWLCKKHHDEHHRGGPGSAPKGDTTQTRRGARRRKRLNEIAQAVGYGSWSAYETVVINGVFKIPPKDARK